MIRFYPETVHTGTVPSLLVFLTTNHYPLTTVLPHHGLMIDTQTATAPPPPPVSRPAFFLTTNHYPLTTAFQAPTHSMIKTGTRGTRKQASEGASNAAVSAPRAESRELKPEDCFPLFRSLSPEVRSRRNPTVGFFPSAANPASSADSAVLPLPDSPIHFFTLSLVQFFPCRSLSVHPPRLTVHDSRITIHDPLLPSLLCFSVSCSLVPLVPRSPFFYSLFPNPWSLFLPHPPILQTPPPPYFRPHPPINSDPPPHMCSVKL